MLLSDDERLNKIIRALALLSAAVDMGGYAARVEIHGLVRDLVNDSDARQEIAALD